MSVEPPPFQEAALCCICKCSFNTFRRRHHCRCCGRTLCYEHSSNQMALPQFGIHSCVRVCADCFNDSSRPRKDDQQASVDAVYKDDSKISPDGVNSVTDGVSGLSLSADVDLSSESTAVCDAVSDCKCGMPLCICETPSPLMDAATFQSQSSTAPTLPASSNPKSKRKEKIPNNGGFSLNRKFCSSFSLVQVTNSSSNGSRMEYEVNGEGLREAIKNGDTAAVNKLLSEGVDANYCDKQGSFLLHLAALFNKTDIAFLLMEYGASVDCMNLQGETPLDCAPATLQYKMRKKMEEREHVVHTT